MNNIVTGIHQNYILNNVVAQQGWQCPVCKRILAPFVTECPCKGQGMTTFTSATGGGLDE